MEEKTDQIGKLLDMLSKDETFLNSDEERENFVFSFKLMLIEI